MATTSKFIQLTSSVLLEYIYADQSAINTPGNPFRLNTTTNPIWLMANAHDNQNIILNADSNEVIQQGLPIGTGNVRNRAYAKIDAYKSALLDIDKVIPYNDYDNKLTPTANLPINFTNPQAPVYDTVRLHLVQGFNFESYEGLIFNLKAKKKDGSLFNLLNFVFNKIDNFETLNPNSFFFGGRVYDSYLEVRVLSLYNLIYDYWLGTLTGDTVVEKITNGNGVLRDQQIQASFSWIRERTLVDDQDYIYLFDSIQVDIPTQDQFEAIAATIQESDAGDYIEFYATYKGNIIQQFIIDLNNNGYDFILLHDLVVSEYVYDETSSQYSWQVTDELQISQTSNFGEPNVYRPVIKNPSAISYKIDYVVRLYNRNDNSQIWKKSSLISNSAAKYGRKLLQLNIGANPVQNLIYNQNVVKDVQINRISEPVLENAKYITSFIDKTQISVSFDTINPDVNVENPSNPSNLNSVNNPYLGAKSAPTIYSNGLARILISDSVSFLKFVIYQADPSTGTNSAMNLSGIGELVLSFSSDTNENIDILEYPSTFTSKSKGEIVYRLTEPQSKQILGLTNRQFRIFLVNQKGERTFLYNGKFFSQTEWMELYRNDKIAGLEKKITDLTGVNTQLMAQVKSQSDMVTQLNDLIKNLNFQLAAEASQNVTEDQTIANLTSQNLSLQSQIDSLNQMVADLNASLSLAQSKILTEQGMIATLQQQLSQQGIILGATSMAVVKPVKQETQLEKDLEPVKASIKNTPATTYTQPKGGGGFTYLSGRGFIFGRPFGSSSIFNNTNPANRFFNR